MKKFILFCWLFGLTTSCRSKQGQLKFLDQIQSAKLEKINAEKILADFKVETSAIFKKYDRLKAKGLVPTEMQSQHDSLFKKGISLAMVVVRSQMKIESLRKIK